jgi:hypothetical protein
VDRFLVLVTFFYQDGSIDEQITSLLEAVELDRALVGEGVPDLADIEIQVFDDHS